MFINFNGSIIEESEATVPLSSRALFYGDGCFDTFRNYKGHFLDLDQHLERFFSSMEYLAMEPPDRLNADSLKDEIASLLKENDLLDKEAVVRIQAWREGSRGYHVDKDAEVKYLIMTGPLPDIPESIELMTVPTRRIPSKSLNSSFKLSNGINYIRAAHEAAEMGGDDALMLTTKDYVSETTTANLFWVKDERIYTPNLECDILPGITRAIINQVIRMETDYRIVKGKFKVDELRQADAAWICNSLKEIVPVHRIDDSRMEPGNKVIETVEAQFRKTKKDQLRPLQS